MPGQTVGRFDLGDQPPVRYLASSPEHAVGEVLSAFRGTDFRASYLRQRGHGLALVETILDAALAERLPDFTVPEVLASLGVRPDELAHHDRTVTQRLARRLHDLGAETGTPAGFRWWSALTGAWHTVVVFTDREGAGEVSFSEPRYLDASEPLVRRVTSQLGIRQE